MRKALSVRSGFFVYGLVFLVLLAPIVLTVRAWRQARLNYALIAAIKQNDMQTAIKWLEQGADANALEIPSTFSRWQFLCSRYKPEPAASEENTTALMLALQTQEGDEEHQSINRTLVHALLSRGANANQRDKEGWTPLMRAVQYQDPGAVKELLSYHANVTLKNNHGEDVFVISRIWIKRSMTAQQINAVNEILHTVRKNTYDLKGAQQVKTEGAVWRVEIWQSRLNMPNGDTELWGGDYVKFLRNGHVVLTQTASDLGGASLEFGKAEFMSPFPLIILRSEPECGNPGPAHLYGIRRGKLMHVVEVDGECGGPILHDYDGDGRLEWVFDDYNWYRYYGKEPKYLLVYKMASDGKLRLWKRLPNRQRRHLPFRLGLSRWGL